MRNMFWFSLLFLLPFSSAENLTRILLECPVGVLANTTNITATYYQQGSLACSSMTLNAVVAGTTVYSQAIPCNNGPGHYLFTSVNTQASGAYTLTATTSDASASCTLTRLSSDRISGVPDLPWWFLLPLSMLALGLLRRSQSSRF